MFPILYSIHYIYTLYYYKVHVRVYDIWNPEKDQSYGWASDGEFYNFINWTKLRANVQKIEVQFRDVREDKHAQIAELEIYYCD